MNDIETLLTDIDPKVLSRVDVQGDLWTINAQELYYRDLNSLLKNMNDAGARRLELHNVYGQRYIGTDLAAKMEITIHGTPGNDLGAFMNGPKLVVHGNAQDGCGNTMNNGLIVVHGRAGDITGYSMRGGKIFVRDDVGYRAGIHMKEYQGKRPCLVVGGTAQDFLGEYMAGGVLVVLGLNFKAGIRHAARFVGTGMHGGVMYIRGTVSHLGREVEVVDLEEEDRRLLHELIREFCTYFGTSENRIPKHEFCKLIPVSHRPYGKLFAY